jgi:hypothetical protein
VYVSTGGHGWSEMTLDLTESRDRQIEGNPRGLAIYGMPTTIVIPITKDEKCPLRTWAMPSRYIHIGTVSTNKKQETSSQ